MILPHAVHGTCLAAPGWCRVAAVVLVQPRSRRARVPFRGLR
jgi:hypothetical protein